MTLTYVSLDRALMPIHLLHLMGFWQIQASTPVIKCCLMLSVASLHVQLVIWSMGKQLFTSISSEVFWCLHFVVGLWNLALGWSWGEKRMNCYRPPYIYLWVLLCHSSYICLLTSYSYEVQQCFHALQFVKFIKVIAFICMMHAWYKVDKRQMQTTARGERTVFIMCVVPCRQEALP